MECELLLRKQSEQVGPHNVCEWSSTHSNHGCFLLTCLVFFALRLAALAAG